MFGVYHISLLTELELNLSPTSYKHFAPTELRTFAHSYLELALNCVTAMISPLIASR